MAYSDFRFPDALGEFGLTLRQSADLFAGVPPLPPDPAVARQLRTLAPMAALQNSEKARSEWIIAPLLGDVWARYGGAVGLYSGHTFAADPDAGLTGLCDFLFCRSLQSTTITPPAVVVVEAKNESIPGGLGQCVAEMVGVQRYNRRLRAAVDPVYGCVTTGSAWKFCQLAGTDFTLDYPEYTLAEADRILGIFAHMLGPIPAAA